MADIKKKCYTFINAPKNASSDITDKTYTYKELIDLYLKLSWAAKATDILFSMNKTKVEEIADKIYAIKEQNAGIRTKPDSSEYGNLEDSFDGYYSPQTLIDSPHFPAKLSKMVREDFLNETIQDLIKEGHNEEEATTIANQIVAHWDKIGEDGSLIHKLLGLDFRNNPNALRSFVQGTPLAYVDPTRLYDMLEGESNVYRTKVVGSVRNYKKLIKNINLKCKLLGLDEEIVGHIDNLVIDDMGGLHIINFKVVTSSLNHSVKNEKYRYELAILKLLLAAEGFNTDNMTLHIVPIRVKYNDDFTKILDIVAMPEKEYTLKDNNYVFTKYDNAAAQMIPSKAVVNLVLEDDVKKADRACEVLWPEGGIHASGIQATVKDWINKGIVTIVSDKPGIYYRVDFGDGSPAVEIDDPTTPLHKNEKVVEVISRKIPLIKDNSYASAKDILRNIRGAYRVGFTTFRTNFGYTDGSGVYLDTLFEPYLQKIKDGDTEDSYLWEILENDALTELNIILLRNKITDRIDVITLSPYDLDAKKTFGGGYLNIAGQYISDIKAREMGGMLEGNYGNIEAIKTMFLLNEVLPKIDGNYSLGNLIVVSPKQGGKGRFLPIGLLNKRYFSKILNLVNENDEEAHLKNNFADRKYADELQEFVRLLRYAENKNTMKPEDLVLLHDWGIDGLYDDEATVSVKLEILKNLITSMEDTWGLKLSPDKLADLTKVSGKAAIYYMAQRAYLKYAKILDKMNFNEDDLDLVHIEAQKRSAVASENYQIVTGLYRTAIDRVADRGLKFSTPISKYLTAYYNAIGYTNFQNSTLGNLAWLFRNLYELDARGLRTMRFKNPYSNSALLTEPERVLLKKALWTFAEIRLKMFGKVKLDFSKTYTDTEMAHFIEENPWYLDVPLRKATKATMRQTGRILRESRERITKALLHPEEYVKKYMSDMDTDEEESARKIDIETMSTHNSYAIYETLNGSGGRIARASAISSKGPDFFETNLETLLIDFGTKFILTEEMKDVLMKAKGCLLTMEIVGDITNKHTANIIKYINEHITVNVHNSSVMDKTALKWVAGTRPIRRLVTGTWIAGNLIAAVRDTSEGLWQNTWRTLNHYQTDITAEDLARAYKEVILHSASNVRSINLLSKLCIKYRISNFDIARVQEGLTTGRAGITNFENWAYSTMRRPDYLNRMTLFVAKLMHDGVWDALSISEDGEIVYNWRKDKRFEKFANPNADTGDSEYQKQMGLYYSAIRQYNLDHPEANLSYKDDLPDPYSFRVVQDIKNVSDSIYGAYDKSERSLWESHALGIMCCLFTTWLNGMTANYLSKRLESGIRLTLDTNEAGELLFFDKEGNIVVLRDNKYIYEETGEEVPPQNSPCVPVFAEIPIVVLGIYYTLTKSSIRVLKAGYNKGGIAGALEEFTNEVWANPDERKNITKFLSDLIMLLFFTAIFKYAITPAYKEYKKDATAQDFLGNVAVSIIYKATLNSYDGFKGPLNILEFFGEKLEPPIYTLPVKLVTDVGKVALGNKTITKALYENTPLLRSFREAYAMSLK